MNRCVKTVCVTMFALVIMGFAGISYRDDSDFIHTFTVTSDWGSGFVADFSITNQSTATADTWTVEFDFPYTINSIWNACMRTHKGNHYVLTNCSWNGKLSPGQSVSFGFQGSPGNVCVEPVYVKIRQ